MPAIEGRNGRFQVNGANANVEKFTVEVSTDRVEATGFEDQLAASGRTQQVLTDGVDRAVGNVQGYVDTAALPATFGFTQGTILTNVFFFLHKTAAAGLRRIAISRAIVLKVNYSVQVKDKIMFDLNIESSGLGGAPAAGIVHPV